ncbi:MAG: copper resistance CopC family protein [Kineosporiaceae bacterium]
MTRAGLRRAAATGALSLPLAIGAVVAGAESAAAHAILIGTAPQDGAVVQQAPGRVSVTFDEIVDKPAYMSVAGPDGRVDAGPAVINGTVVSVGLERSIAAGSYTVAYRVVSDDGHPVEGGFAFRLAGAAAPQPATTQPSSGSSGDGHWAAAGAGVAVVIVGAGAVLWERLHRRTPDDQGTP